jgi:hypothetical protein
MKSKSILKLPNQLNLGTILPGQYGEISLPLKSSSVAFLTLELSKRAVSCGFFLLREGTNDCKNEMSVVVKQGVPTNIIVASYPEEVSRSTTHHGELYVSEEGNVHTIRLLYKIELPRILCRKLLENTASKERLIRIIVNKAVTNEGRVMLTNQEDYALELQPGLLVNHTIADRENPFLLKVNSGVLQVEAKEQFIVFLSLTTNIGFKQEFKGMKKCVLRNVLTLKTNSTLVWCLPIEVLVIFVKQPEMKE